MRTIPRAIDPASRWASAPRRAAAAKPSSRGRMVGSAADARRQHTAAGPTAQLPDRLTRHLLSRFTNGVTSARLADVAAAGGIQAWFDQQLVPDGIPDHRAAELWDWFPVLALSPYEKWQRYQRGTQQGWEMMQDLASWTMLLRLSTRRQLREVMSDFWADALHVPSPADEAWVFRVEYQNMLRHNALGSFTNLLKEAITHPCMGLYLDNVESTRTAINENLGRELLECHTVGLHYTQKDVVDSARILTGFHVDRRRTWESSYVPADHWVGPVKVLGFSSANRDPDGRGVLDDYLTYLARHEVTAQRLCRRLAVRFVSDDPSDHLVASLAKVYQDSGTQIRPVLRALVASAEFRDSVLQKVRTPVEDALATWGVLRADVARPQHSDDGGNQFINVSKAIGQVVFDWPAPNGFPDIAGAWTGTGRILGSMRTHWYAAGGYWPNRGVTFPRPIDWMPALPASFEDVVRHVVGQVLFLPMTTRMLGAACAATEIEPDERIDPQHALVAFKLPRLLVTLLDTPEHLSR